MSKIFRSYKLTQHISNSSSETNNTETSDNVMIVQADESETSSGQYDDTLIHLQTLSTACKVHFEELSRDKHDDLADIINKINLSKEDKNTAEHDEQNHSDPITDEVVKETTVEEVGTGTNIHESLRNVEMTINESEIANNLPKSILITFEPTEASSTQCHFSELTKDEDVGTIISQSKSKNFKFSQPKKLQNEINNYSLKYVSRYQNLRNV
jgi:hypothetical protein